MGVIMLGVSIASASLTCKLLCCRSNNQSTVHYIPTQGAYIPNQGVYNLNQGAYNPNQGPYNPNQGPYNPNQGHYNPNQVSSNVLLNPNYNPNHIASVHPPNIQAPSTSAQLLQTSDNPPAYQEVAGTGNNCQKF